MKKTLISFVAVFALLLNVNAQKGSTILAEYRFTVDQNGTTPVSLTNTGTENGVSLTIINPTAVASRTDNNAIFAPNTYTHSMRPGTNGGVELSGDLSSIGSFELDVQNGSSSNDAVITTSVWNGTAWQTADVTSLPASTRLKYRPQTVISKSPARVRVTFSTGGVWFYGLQVFNNTNPDGAPQFVSSTPAESENLSAVGNIRLQFDEYLNPVNISAISLGNATVSSVQNFGNTLQVDYTGLTNPSNPVLSISGAGITDFSGTALSSDVSLVYAIDNDAPVLQNITPADGSTIHINDLGEEARKIKLTFNEPITFSMFGFSPRFTNAHNPSDAVFVMPKIENENTLVLSYAGLQYSSTYTLIIPPDFIADLSGNFWESASFTFHTAARDNTPPVLTSTIPNNPTLPIGGSFSFSFDEIVQISAQNATVNGQPVILSNNNNVIGLNYTNAPYASNIEVLIPAGIVTDTLGNAYASEIRFFFNSETKIPRTFDIIVDAGTSIQDAINSISDDTQRTLIYVKNGTYQEKLAVWKNNVSLIGESTDGVIITWSECSSTSTLQPQYNTGINSPGTDASYTMLINGSDFYGENFTVRNDYNHAGGTDANKQAVALHHRLGDRHVLKNIKMFSFQDTYYPNTASTRQYVINPHIIGGTDFIFGRATNFIEGGIIECWEGGQYITAASTTPREFGLIINNATVRYAGLEPIGSKRQFYLGRPWGANSKTAFLNSTFEDGLIRSEGWSVWSGNDNHLSVNNVTYNNTGFATNNFANWSRQIDAQEASRYNIDNAFNFGANNVWNPLPFSTAPDAPVVREIHNRHITWDAVDFAVGYLVFAGGSADNLFLIGNTTDLSFEYDLIGAVILHYAVKAYNAYGAMSDVSNITGTGIYTPKVQSGFLKNTLLTGELELKNPEDFSKVEILSLSGQKLLSANVNNAIINISALSSGIYIAKGFAKNGGLYSDKFVKQ